MLYIEYMGYDLLSYYYYYHNISSSGRSRSLNNNDKTTNFLYLLDLELQFFVRSGPEVIKNHTQLS